MPLYYLQGKKKILLCKKTRIADSYFKKFGGLMLEQRKKFNYALIFPLGRETIAGASIHMLFVFFPIDVLWLDSGKRVVDLKKNLGPWTLNASPKKPAQYIVELPAGITAKNRVKIGSRVCWQRIFI